MPYRKREISVFASLKANILFHRLLKRPNIDKAYKMVPPTDSWYDTITTVHESLARLQKYPHEILEITSHDGLKMKAVYYPSGSTKTMVWAHGYTSHAERESAFPGLFYRSLGYNLLIPYQRAHHISQGRYISMGALEYRDMLTWVDKVNQLVPDGSVVLHGLSMGGSIVLYMVDQAMKNVKCIVSDAPSEGIAISLKNICQGIFKKEADQVYRQLVNRFEKEFSVSISGFDTRNAVRRSRYPIFLTAGSNEKMDAFLYELQKENPNETKVCILPGCNHGNGMYKQTGLYQGSLKEFLENWT